MANNYIKTITDYKKQWQDATNAGDTKAADKVAANAQKSISANESFGNDG